MSADDGDTMAVSQNIAKARARWGQLCHLLMCQGASRKAMGLFYQATVQAVLLHGAETWTLTQPLLRMLHSFHHRCARYLVRMVNTQKEDRTWVIPPSQVARAQAGLLTIEEYIQRWVNTFLPFIRSRPIYQECQDSQATQAAANHPIWWAAAYHAAPTEMPVQDQGDRQRPTDREGAAAPPAPTSLAMPPDNNCLVCQAKPPPSPPLPPVPAPVYVPRHTGSLLDACSLIFIWMPLFPSGKRPTPNRAFPIACLSLSFFTPMMEVFWLVVVF